MSRQSVWSTFPGSSSNQGGVVPNGPPVCSLLGQVVLFRDGKTCRQCRRVCAIFSPWLCYFFGCVRANQIKHCANSTVLNNTSAYSTVLTAFSTVLITHCCAMISTVRIAQCQQYSANSAVLIAQCPLAQCLLHSAFSTILIEQCAQHGACGRVLKQLSFFFSGQFTPFWRELWYAANYAFVCYFLSLKLASVLSYYAFPSLGTSEKNHRLPTPRIYKSWSNLPKFHKGGPLRTRTSQTG